MTIAIPPLSARVVFPEVMDQPDLEADRHRRALDGLARLNWWSGASRPFRASLRELSATVGGRPVRLLDVAAGGGEVPVALAKWATRVGIGLELTLCDRSERAITWARGRAAAAGIPATALVHDVTGAPLPGRYDMVMSSLFVHHLDPAAMPEALATMARAAARLLVVTDLARTRSGYALAAGASKLLTRSPVVHTDALLSVRAALTLDEARRLTRASGLEGAAVDRCWPQRWRLVWWRR